MARKHLPLLLILLLALLLRSYRLMDIPPGLTHDEANHGREAIEVLDGVYRYFFPLNYGSEPIYSYTVAASMKLLGENLLALRLVNVFSGLAAIAATYLWVSRAFDQRTARLTAVLLALSFWPLASSREALRAGMLPFFMALAVWFFWQLCRQNSGSSGKNRPNRYQWAALLALAIVATLHIYLAARTAWLTFPLFVGYLAYAHRSMFQRVWLPTLLALLLAGLLSVPMLIYLGNHPEAQTRLGMLDGTVQALLSGNFYPLWQTASAALLAFVWPGYGDQFLAYNIPGRPVFDSLTAVFFVLGLLVCLWRWQRPSYTFVLLWFGVGILPSLLTGPTANTTRNLAALPAVFLLPAIGFWGVVDAIRGLLSQHLVCGGRGVRPATAVGLTLWLLWAGWRTTSDYFISWGSSAAVRSAYQHTLVEELAYLSPSSEPQVFSTVYPGPAHDASIALLLAGQSLPVSRWVDARRALIVPDTPQARFIIPASTPPHPLFTTLLQPLETITLRPDDLDPSFTLYRRQPRLPEWVTAVTLNANFGNAVQLRHAQWLVSTTPPGDVAELLTVWEVLNPQHTGPLVPPAYTPDTVLFTHILNKAGHIVGQQDALDAPSWSWQTGDLVVQIHAIWIPPETAVGPYPTIVGLYDRASGSRLAVMANNGQPQTTFASVPPLQVAPTH